MMEEDEYIDAIDYNSVDKTTTLAIQVKEWASKAYNYFEVSDRTVNLVIKAFPFNTQYKASEGVIRCYIRSGLPQELQDILSETDKLATQRLLSKPEYLELRKKRKNIKNKITRLFHALGQAVYGNDYNTNTPFKQPTNLLQNTNNNNTTPTIKTNNSSSLKKLNSSNSSTKLQSNNTNTPFKQPTNLLQNTNNNNTTPTIKTNNSSSLKKLNSSNSSTKLQSNNTNKNIPFDTIPKSDIVDKHVLLDKDLANIYVSPTYNLHLLDIPFSMLVVAPSGSGKII
jgi:hypothetical protein